MGGERLTMRIRDRGTLRRQPAHRPCRGQTPLPARIEVIGREIVAAFLNASRNAQFDALLALLDPEVVLAADEATVQMGGAAQVLGASAVAETLSGRARAAQPVLV